MELVFLGTGAGVPSKERKRLGSCLDTLAGTWEHMAVRLRRSNTAPHIGYFY